MTHRGPVALGICILLAGCSPRDEFQHQTVEAYQANDSLRQSLLQKCAGHITGKRPFNTQSDTDECRKAAAADQNVRLAQHQAREQAVSNAALSAAAKQFETK